MIRMKAMIVIHFMKAIVAQASAKTSVGTVMHSVIPALTALLVMAITFSLGQWQLRRADEKRALGQAREQAQKAVPRAIDAAELAAVKAPSALENQAIQVRGRFDERYTVLIDNRTVNGKAGFHVVTPLKLEDSEMVVAVLRGWVERDIKDVKKIPLFKTPSPDQPLSIQGIAQTNLGKSFDLLKLRYPTRLNVSGSSLIRCLMRLGLV
jgi:surfeit locus 1 family protein